MHSESSASKLSWVFPLRCQADPRPWTSTQRMALGALEWHPGHRWLLSASARFVCCARFGACRRAAEADLQSQILGTEERWRWSESLLRRSRFAFPCSTQKLAQALHTPLLPPDCDDIDIRLRSAQETAAGTRSNPAHLRAFAAVLRSSSAKLADLVTASGVEMPNSGGERNTSAASTPAHETGRQIDLERNLGTCSQRLLASPADQARRRTR